MPAALPDQTTTEPETVAAPEPAQIIEPEVVLSDGQTEAIPEVQQIEQGIQSSDVPQLGLPPMTMTTDTRYSKDEFQEVFNSFFDFLKG